MDCKMRRKEREMPKENALNLLMRGEYGVLSSVSDIGQPYGIPVSYVYENNFLYFHCAKTGHKIENFNANPKICFTVVGKTKPVYQNSFTTHYESVVIFGTVSEVVEDSLKEAVLTKLCEKHLPEHMDKAPASIQNSLSRTSVYKIDICNISGKESK